MTTWELVTSAEFDSRWQCELSIADRVSGWTSYYYGCDSAEYRYWLDRWYNLRIRPKLTSSY